MARDRPQPARAGRRWRGRRAVAGQPGPDILARAEDAVGLHEQPGVLAAPGQDVACAMAGPVGDAGVAAGRAGLAAIVRVQPGQQVHLRADPVIVVHRHVERHAEPMDQRAQVEVDARADDGYARATRRPSAARRRGRRCARRAATAPNGRGSAGTESAMPRSVAFSSRKLARPAEPRDQIARCAVARRRRARAKPAGSRAAGTAEQRGGDARSGRGRRRPGGRAARRAGRSWASARPAALWPRALRLCAPAPKLTSPAW